LNLSTQPSPRGAAGPANFLDGALDFQQVFRELSKNMVWAAALRRGRQAS
jgi:hypothetical protein